MNNLTDQTIKRDELDDLTDEELRILIEGFEGDLFLLLLNKYKPMREVYLNRKIRSAAPVTGALAMKAIGEVQGQNIELSWFFEKLPEQCKTNMEKRKKALNKTEEVSTMTDGNQPINPLTGI